MFVMNVYKEMEIFQFPKHTLYFYLQTFAQKTMGKASFLAPLMVAFTVLGNLNACLLSGSRQVVTFFPDTSVQGIIYSFNKHWVSGAHTTWPNHWKFTKSVLTLGHPEWMIEDKIYRQFYLIVYRLWECYVHTIYIQFWTTCCSSYIMITWSSVPILICFQNVVCSSTWQTTPFHCSHHPHKVQDSMGGPCCHGSCVIMYHLLLINSGAKKDIMCLQWSCIGWFIYVLREMNLLFALSLYQVR